MTVFLAFSRDGQLVVDSAEVCRHSYDDVVVWRGTTGLTANWRKADVGDTLREAILECIEREQRSIKNRLHEIAIYGEQIEKAMGVIEQALNKLETIEEETDG